MPVSSTLPASDHHCTATAIVRSSGDRNSALSNQVYSVDYQQSGLLTTTELTNPRPAIHLSFITSASTVLKMSVTVTENPATYSFARTLADYDIHHSADDEVVSADLNPRPAPQGTGQNPPDWEDNFRRVPEYRPIDHDIDFEYRNVYSNVIERAFVWNLFTGVQLVAVGQCQQPSDIHL